MANLVAKAFANNSFRLQLQRQDNSKEITYDEEKQTDSDPLQGDPSEPLPSPGLDEGAGGRGPNPPTDGLLSSLLRIIGLDNGKLGAMAINGLIFIAQMVR